MLIIRPYNMASASVHNLLDTMGKKNLRRISPDKSNVTTKDEDIIINWGCTRDILLRHKMGHWLNNPDKIKTCTNKLAFFGAVQSYPGQRPRIPNYTADIVVALTWAREGATIVARKKLASHSGDGIVLYTPNDLHADKIIPKAPLYTQYIRKNQEFRVHFYRSQITGHYNEFFTQEKKRKLGFENPDWQIRNLANGFIYAHNDVMPPGDVIDQARRAIVISDLDFGAVDVIYNEATKRAYVLEINTAPGLTGQTLIAYKGMFNTITNDILNMNQHQDAHALIDELA